MHGKRAEGERVRLFMVGEVGAQRQQRGGYMSSVFFFVIRKKKRKEFQSSVGGFDRESHENSFGIT